MTDKQETNHAFARSRSNDGLGNTLTDEECAHFINLSAVMGTNDMVRAIYKVAQDHLREEMTERVLTHLHATIDMNWKLMDDLQIIVGGVGIDTLRETLVTYVERGVVFHERI